MDIKKVKKELLGKYQVRKNKKQKTAFIDYVTYKASAHGHSIKIEEKKGLINSRNIVVGDVDKADIIYTAHYDTCAWSPLPNMIWLKNPVAYCLYQLFLLCAMVAVGFAVSLVVALLANTATYTLYVFEGVLILIALQMMFGIRNKRTANDNTSGVLTLMTIMEKIPEKDREKVAFVFFDNEEKGLIGSSAFKNMHQTDNKLVVNFDCVGEGEHVFFVFNKSTEKKNLDLMTSSFVEDERYSSHCLKGGFFIFPSDQLHFTNGVGVASAKKCALGGYKVGRLHTGRDNVLDENNIEFLSKWACGLVALRNEGQ